MQFERRIFILWFTRTPNTKHSPTNIQTLLLVGQALVFGSLKDFLGIDLFHQILNF